MTDGYLPPLPDAIPRVIGRDGAIALGMSRHAIDHRVSSGSWRRVLPRTYLTVDTMTDLDRCRAALVFAGDGAALSGAAALWASDVRTVAVPEELLVLVPPANRTRSAAWVRVRRTLRPIEIEQWLGPRRVAPARAAADLALGLRQLDDVRALVARVVRDGHASLSDLAAELERGPRNGSRFLRRALEEVAGGAWSAPEARAARLMRQAGLPEFEQNAPIRLEGGGRYVADFLWRRFRAVLEIDSVEYHVGPREWRNTMDRHLALTTLGYSVVHRPPSAVAAPGFTDEIGAWLRSRGWAR